jgi:hypothetical protein
MASQSTFAEIAALVGDPVRAGVLHALMDGRALTASEHIAGIIGAALCAHSFASGSVCRIDGTRAVAITPKGQRAFREVFGVQLG